MSLPHTTVSFSQSPMSNCQAKVFGKKSGSNVYHFDFVFLKDLQFVSEKMSLSHNKYLAQAFLHANRLSAKDTVNGLKWFL